MDQVIVDTSRPRVGVSTAEVAEFFVVAAGFVVVALVGLPLAIKVDPSAISGLDWLAVPAQGEDIGSIWTAVLAAHAAVAAISPILGYTLLTSAANPSSRIAPAGFVVAHEIKWRPYLLRMLSLLAGSLLAFCFAPSQLGLLAAIAAASYAIAATFVIFRDGFQLLEFEDELDDAARRYLRRVVSTPIASLLDGESKSRRSEFGDWLSKLPSEPSGAKGRRFTLRVGVKGRSSELLRIMPQASQRLESLAGAKGLGLRRTGVTELPERLDIGEMAIIRVLREPRVVAGEEVAALVGLSEVEASEVLDLQRQLDELIHYGDGPWAIQQRRVPLIILRNLTTVLHDAIQRQALHDFQYGLDVLGGLIDDIVETTDLRSRGFDWIHETPQGLVRKVAAGSGDHLFTLRLVDFLRGRLSKFLGDGRDDSLTRAYFHLLGVLLVGSMRRSAEATEAVCLYLREIPWYARENKAAAVQLTCRELILAGLSPSVSGSDFAEQRRIVFRAIAEAMR